MTKLIKLEKTNCVPCTMVSNYLDENHVEYTKIDVMDSPEVAAQYDIATVPVVILLDNEGNEIGRSMGYNPHALEELINRMSE